MIDEFHGLGEEYFDNEIKNRTFGRKKSVEEELKKDEENKVIQKKKLIFYKKNILNVENRKSEPMKQIQKALALSHQSQDANIEENKVEKWKEKFIGLKEQFILLQTSLVEACQKIKHFENFVNVDNESFGDRVLDQDSKG